MSVEMSSEVIVKLVRHMAADEFVVEAARVSFEGDNIVSNIEGSEGLINYLMAHRHGSPFEHVYFTFYVEAPLFVFREWQRHRMSSFNEMSGRYTVLKPKFYTPGEGRKMINIGTSARPEMVEGKASQFRFVRWTDKVSSHMAWWIYKARLKMGVSNEVARSILPLNIYSQMRWSVNARSLMNFLSLRVESEDSRYLSRPQWEIQMGAEKVEQEFAEVMPVTYAAFIKNGRMAP